jgi:hypothetical protein
LKVIIDEKAGADLDDTSRKAAGPCTGFPFFSVKNA